MRDFSILIQDWFRQKGRDLPWRNTSNPYFIWLSEIILQQTRVDQGLAYYLKFIDHYPTVQDLANATEDEVLNDWQGLGYYSRARNLHFSAKYIATELKGQFPNTYKDVLSLKGVGDYTAAAICSFSYNQAYPVVDGNVYRVISRYLNIETAIDSTEGKKIFKEAASELLDDKNPADHNQAIMELGALVCKPKSPDCEKCPVHEGCRAREKQTVDSLPIKSKKTKVRKRYFHYLVLLKDEHILIKKRRAGDIWQGLYDFPLIEYPTNKKPTKKELENYHINKAETSETFKHILSHQQIFATFWLSDVSEHIQEKDIIRIPYHQIEDYPLPKLLIRYIESSPLFAAD